MDKKVELLIKRIKEHLTTAYGDKIKQVILYGSHARGKATKDSDIDILVLVDESLNPFEVRKNLSDLLLDILLEEGELVSLIILPEHFFETYNYPFMLNVKREGIKI
jgi:predicted nucleotidyltransferase